MPAETFVRLTRVQLHPALDAWMQGDRYGTVQCTTWPRSKGSAHGRKEVVHVLMDKSNRVLRMRPGDLDAI